MFRLISSLTLGLLLSACNQHPSSMEWTRDCDTYYSLDSRENDICKKALKVEETSTASTSQDNTNTTSQTSALKSSPASSKAVQIDSNDYNMSRPDEREIGK